MHLTYTLPLARKGVFVRVKAIVVLARGLGLGDSSVRDSAMLLGTWAL